MNNVKSLTTSILSFLFGCSIISLIVYWILSFISKTTNFSDYLSTFSKGDILSIIYISFSIEIAVIIMLWLNLNEKLESYQSLLAQQESNASRLEEESQKKEKEYKAEHINLLSDFTQFKKYILKDLCNSFDKDTYCEKLISDLEQLGHHGLHWNKRYSISQLTTHTKELREELKVIIDAYNYYRKREKQRFEAFKKAQEESIQKQYQDRLGVLEKREALVDSITKSYIPFQKTATMKTDMEMLVFDESIDYLRTKPHPAHTTANRIEQELKTKAKEWHYAFKEMQYKYDFLLNIFPELKNYVDDDISLVHLSNYNDYEAFNEERDRTIDWIRQEEYDRLSENERNQLALDNYKKRSNKSNWELGIDYEMFIGYLLREGKLINGEKLIVEQYGEKHGLNDLGRDIIAHATNSNGEIVYYVIQCKRWAKDKVIHENTVCQLYGTTLEYKISKEKEFFNVKIIPMLISTADLSPTAKAFAEKLGVEFRLIEMGDYPMIKCNIDSKIYHLPFDQQYHRTEILESKGEFYAWTVSEAVQKGYRRAFRHIME